MSQSFKERDKAQNQGFSQEDIWHEMRFYGCTHQQAVKSLIESEKRLDD